MASFAPFAVKIVLFGALTLSKTLQTYCASRNIRSSRISAGM